MELLIAVLVSVGSIVAAIICNMVASELYDRSSRLAHWLIEYAVARLPEHQRERYREEWLGHLSECPGKLGKLWHALGCMFGARAVGLAHPKPDIEHRLEPNGDIESRARIGRHIDLLAIRSLVALSRENRGLRSKCYKLLRHKLNLSMPLVSDDFNPDAEVIDAIISWWSDRKTENSDEDY